MPTREQHQQPLTIYYAAQRFLLTVNSFVLERRRSPYRRLAATLLIAQRNPFYLEVGGGASLTTHAALLAPKVQRRYVSAEQSDIAIFDIPFESSDYRLIEPLVRGQSLVSFDRERFAPLSKRLKRAAAGKLNAREFERLHTAAARIVAGSSTPGPLIDARVLGVMRQVERMSLDEVSLSALARGTRLSASRLRHLFCRETGSTLTHYARWVAVWRAVNCWTQGRSWTEIAHTCGFFDVAHFHHAFKEVFGLAPSAIFDPPRVRLIRV